MFSKFAHHLHEAMDQAYEQLHAQPHTQPHVQSWTTAQLRKAKLTVDMARMLMTDELEPEGCVAARWVKALRKARLRISLHEMHCEEALNKVIFMEKVMKNDRNRNTHFAHRRLLISRCSF